MNDDNIFIRLVEAVEAQGGELLPETHYGETITYPKGKPAQTTGCGLESVLSVPYDHYESSRDGEPSGLPELRYVTACAVDDAMHLWPRFVNEVYA